MDEYLLPKISENSGGVKRGVRKLISLQVKSHNEDSKWSDITVYKTAAKNKN